ncbi:lytic transglycosylase domain-containing protein [Aromatoleum diolicum]|uniref:Transglycosylase SLT domain-containing protein n=1 Tax=Aromatoleum diolicum TaxID=75796 RepID=A0ABX1QF57_9RHOO|nr:transglycosylase SLT domain-containing protein [Aromatoleum diolicum]NMG77076.1 transglycosylase SLT domain-containing protein [Aromatoleum diolicum]
MSHATHSGRLLNDAAAFFVHFVHGGLSLAGLVILACVGAAYLQNDPVSYADVGVIESRSPAPVIQVAEVAEPEPPRAHRVQTSMTLSAEMQRVRDFVAGRYKLSTRSLEPLLAAAETSGRKLGIDPLLIVAVMAIESSFNPFAESNMGAQGLMQVIPRFHLDKIGHGAHEDALFDPMLNIRVGTQVLVEGLQRFGSLQAALQYYGGALRDPNASYANKVLAMKKRLMAAAGRGTGTAAVTGV